MQDAAPLCALPECGDPPEAHLAACRDLPHLRRPAQAEAGRATGDTTFLSLTVKGSEPCSAP